MVSGMAKTDYLAGKSISQGKNFEDGVMGEIDLLQDSGIGLTDIGIVWFYRLHLKLFILLI